MGNRTSTQLSGFQIAGKQVGNEHVKPQAVGTQEIVDRAVTSAKIAGQAVLYEHLGADVRRRVLPETTGSNRDYQAALVNCPSNPSASNPFVTFSDLSRTVSYWLNPVRGASGMRADPTGAIRVDMNTRTLIIKDDDQVVRDVSFDHAAVVNPDGHPEAKHVNQVEKALLSSLVSSGVGPDDLVRTVRMSLGGRKARVFALDIASLSPGVVQVVTHHEIVDRERTRSVHVFKGSTSLYGTVRDHGHGAWFTDESADAYAFGTRSDIDSAESSVQTSGTNEVPATALRGAIAMRLAGARGAFVDEIVRKDDSTATAILAGSPVMEPSPFIMSNLEVGGGTGYVGSMIVNGFSKLGAVDAPGTSEHVMIPDGQGSFYIFWLDGGGAIVGKRIHSSGEFSTSIVIGSQTIIAPWRSERMTRLAGTLVARRESEDVTVLKIVLAAYSAETDTAWVLVSDVLPDSFGIEGRSSDDILLNFAVLELTSLSGWLSGLDAFTVETIACATVAQASPNATAIVLACNGDGMRYVSVNSDDPSVSVVAGMPSGPSASDFVMAAGDATIEVLLGLNESRSTWAKKQYSLSGLHGTLSEIAFSARGGSIGTIRASGKGRVAVACIDRADDATTYDPQGDAVLTAWIRDDVDGGGLELFWQILDATGTAVTKEIHARRNNPRIASMKIVGGVMAHMFMHPADGGQGIQYNRIGSMARENPDMIGTSTDNVPLSTGIGVSITMDQASLPFASKRVMMTSGCGAWMTGIVSTFSAYTMTLDIDRIDAGPEPGVGHMYDVHTGSSPSSGQIRFMNSVPADVTSFLSVTRIYPNSVDDDSNNVDMKLRSFSIGDQITVNNEDMDGIEYGLYTITAIVLVGGPSTSVDYYSVTPVIGAGTIGARTRISFQRSSVNDLTVSLWNDETDIDSITPQMLVSPGSMVYASCLPARTWFDGEYWRTTRRTAHVNRSFLPSGDDGRTLADHDLAVLALDGAQASVHVYRNPIRLRSGAADTGDDTQSALIDIGTIPPVEGASLCAVTDDASNHKRSWLFGYGGIETLDRESSAVARLALVRRMEVLGTIGHTVKLVDVAGLQARAYHGTCAITNNAINLVPSIPGNTAFIFSIGGRLIGAIENEEAGALAPSFVSRLVVQGTDDETDGIDNMTFTAARTEDLSKIIPPGVKPVVFMAHNGSNWHLVVVQAPDVWIIGETAGTTSWFTNDMPGESDVVKVGPGSSGRFTKRGATAFYQLNSAGDVVWNPDYQASMPRTTFILHVGLGDDGLATVKAARFDIQDPNNFTWDNVVVDCNRIPMYRDDAAMCFAGMKMTSAQGDRAILYFFGGQSGGSAMDDIWMFEHWYDETASPAVHRGKWIHLTSSATGSILQQTISPAPARLPQATSPGIMSPMGVYMFGGRNPSDRITGDLAFIQIPEQLRDTADMDLDVAAFDMGGDHTTVDSYVVSEPIDISLVEEITGPVFGTFRDVSGLRNFRMMNVKIALMFDSSEDLVSVDGYGVWSAPFPISQIHEKAQSIQAFSRGMMISEARRGFEFASSTTSMRVAIAFSTDDPGDAKMIGSLQFMTNLSNTDILETASPEEVRCTLVSERAVAVKNETGSAISLRLVVVLVEADERS